MVRNPVPLARKYSLIARDLLDTFARLDSQMLTYLFDISKRLIGTRIIDCPCCGYSGAGFRGHGHPPRYDARCPRCGSLERHRLFALMNARHEIVRAHADILHIAPERTLRSTIETSARRYFAADLVPGPGTREENLEALSFVEASLDTIICIHVLEHLDDYRALRECHRVLRAGGRLVCMVPVVEGWPTTYEDARIHDATQRAHHFGQHDHRRYYGQDVRDRIRAAGFELTEHTATPSDVVAFGLTRGEKVFVGQKT